MNLCIVGSIGVLNVGDDAIVVAFLKWLNDRSDQTHNTYVCSRSVYILENLRGLHRVKVRLVNGFGVLKGFSCSRFIIVCGGDYLDDFGSLLTRIRAFVLLFSLAFVARMSLKKFLMVNNGFRANSVLGLSFERIILKLTNCVSVRDEASHQLVNGFKQVKKGFDTAVLWHKSISNAGKTDGESSISGHKKIGLSISPFFSNFFSDPDKDSKLAGEIAKSLKDLLSHETNVEIHFLAFNTNRKSGDQELINEIVTILGSYYKDKIKTTAYDGGICDFLQKLSRMDYIICCKYHSMLFSYILKKPMLVIKYHPKAVALASEIKLPLKALMSVNDVLEGRLFVKVSELLRDPSGFMAMLPIATAERNTINGFQECLEGIIK